MKPKEKAIEIVLKVKNLIEDKFASSDCKEPNHVLLERTKLVANYVVDEILEIKSVVDDSLEKISSEYASLHPNYKSYWKKVKEEVNSLKS
jgi:3-methyladenine DNA glycosylase AlkD